MADECLDIVNERSAWPVTAAFTDDNGEPVTPTGATYRVDDEASRTNIVPVTSISPLSSSVDIVVTSDQNFIIRRRKKYEVRTVTVEFDYSSSHGPAHATGQYKYKLLNLTTIKVHIIDFCENCGKSRRVSLVSIGKWFIWYCLPCQLRYQLNGLVRKLFK
jgi:hypothetical protein